MLLQGMLLFRCSWITSCPRGLQARVLCTDAAALTLALAMQIISCPLDTFSGPLCFALSQVQRVDKLLPALGHASRLGRCPRQPLAV